MTVTTDEKRTELALAVLRVVVGVIFIVHGSMKVADIGGTTSGFQSMGIPAPEVSVYLAILGELAGGMGLALGLLTPAAALGPLCVMIMAIAYVHAGHGLLANKGGWEYPLTLLLVSLVFVARGGGAYSLDAVITRARAHHRHEPIGVHGW
jgi:putative oxidoreductase